MARKTAIIKISDEGRDYGKTFFIREMPARYAETWATRALLALARSGVEIDENVLGAGMVGLLIVGYKMLCNLKYEEVEQLLAEMFQCVTFIPDERRPEFTRPLVDMGTDGDDIEEVQTRLKLRKAVFDLHVNFTSAGVSSITFPQATDSMPAGSSNTSTSPGRLRRRFQPGVQR